jgi:hypothetical protein
MADPYSGLRDKDFSTGGKDVRDTKMIDGTASDSLSGKNSTVQYETTGGVPKDNLGGMPSGK